MGEPTCPARQVGSHPSSPIIPRGVEKVFLVTVALTLRTVGQVNLAGGGVCPLPRWSPAWLKAPSLGKRDHSIAYLVTRRPRNPVRMRLVAHLCHHQGVPGRPGLFPAHAG